MFSNPFSPIFGGKPDIFFGRDDILLRFDIAMIDHGSEDRAFFFTGTRGSGKTALLEQLSIRATKAGRTVIDLGPEDTIEQLVYQLAGYDETTAELSPQASVSIMGVGGSVSGGSISKTKHADRAHLQTLLLDACTKAKHGILVTVDEIQKLPLEDVSSLCNAFQMASRKGHDIMLAVAGLPYAYKNIIQHEGCTYLRRTSHEELGVFSWEVTKGAFIQAFKRVRGLHVESEIIDKLNSASYGHPYLMQLLGYYLITLISQTDNSNTHVVSVEESEQAIQMAVLAYEQRALKPLLDELRPKELSYIRAMAHCLDDKRLASSNCIAKELNTGVGDLSYIRSSLMGSGIIASPERGSLMFCIPYLAAYILGSHNGDNAITEAQKRGI